MSRYIDTDEVLEQIRKKLGIKSLDYLLEAERQIVDVIQSTPSIDIEPKRGEWIEMGQNEDGIHNVKCNQCDSAYKMRGHAKSISTKLKYRFCPRCGARMKGADDEADRP